MNFEQGQIVKIKAGDTFLFGRVRSVDRHGDGVATFKSQVFPNVIISPIMPEMVVEAFWQDGKGRYGV